MTESAEPSVQTPGAAPQTPPAPSYAAFFERLRSGAYSPGDREGGPVDLHGWMDPKFEASLARIIASGTGRPIRVLEIGSWKGRSASVLGRLLKERADGSTLLCIDTWLGAPEFWTWGIDDPTRGGSLCLEGGYPSVFHTFVRNMRALGLDRVVAPFPISSEQGFEVLRYYSARFDLIYVDASHEEAAVIRDMENAWCLLNPGGVMFGDDYSQSWPGVVAAVNQFSQFHRVRGVIDGVLWFMPKPA